MSLILSGTDGLSDVDGSASTPAIRGTDANTGIFFPAADTIAFTEGGTEAARFNSSGNLGIGTASPACRLDLNRGSAGLLANFTDGVNTNFQIETASLLATIGPSAGSTAMAFKTGNTERMRIDSSGNVGIGTSSPSAKLTVVAGTNSSADLNALTLLNDGENGTNLNFNNTFGALAQIKGTKLGGGASANEGVLAFSTAFNSSLTERMRIDSDGNLLVGTTSNPSSARFNIVSNGASNTADFRSSLTTGLRTVLAFYDGSNDFCGQIYIDAGTNTTVYSTSSDYRLKENIAPMTGALAKVQALKPCTYTWKANGSNGQGFIAHELQEYFPEAVSYSKNAIEIINDLDEDGKVIGTKEVPKYQGIDTSFLVATLTAAIQEQQAMIEELKAEVAALKAA